MINLLLKKIIASLYGFACGNETVATLIKFVLAPFPGLKISLKRTVFRLVPELVLSVAAASPIDSSYINNYNNPELLPLSVEKIYLEILQAQKLKDQSL